MTPYCSDRVVPELFVGRAELLAEAASRVAAGRSCILTAGRRTGKTMFLRRLASVLAGRGVVSVYIDAQRLRGPDAARDLVRTIASEAGAFLAGGPDESVEAAATAIVGRGVRLTLIIDEIESLARVQDGPVLLDNLRYLVSNSPIAGDATVVIAGGLDSHLALRSAGSPLANVCAPLTLAPLDEADLAALVALGVPTNQQASARDYLLRAAGGHPYLAQALLEALPDGGVADLDAALAPTALRLVERVAAQIVGLDPVLLGAIRELEGGRGAPVDRLLSTGLVREDGGSLVLNGDIVRGALDQAADRAAPRTIDEHVIASLLAAGETPEIEFKASIRWDLRQQRENEALRLEVPKTLAAFMNAAGGTLVIGVTNDGERIGLARDMALNRRNPTVDGLLLVVSELLRSTLGGVAAGRVRFHTAGPATDPLLILEADPSPLPVFVAANGQVAFHVRLGTSSAEFNVREAVGYILEHWPGIDRL